MYCQTSGSNLNAGSTTADAAAFTYASGNWVASTGVFTVASGSPSGDGVAVGDFASVYPDGSSVAVFVGRVTARDTTTITVSLTAKSGTAPTDGTGNRTLKIGGAWAGPSGSTAFPFGFVQSTMTNASGDAPRVNLKNNATYSITAAMTHANAGPLRFQGYSATPGDGGAATIDGGSSGASYVPLTVSADNVEQLDLTLNGNGATGSASGLVISGAEGLLSRVSVSAMRGAGVSVTGAGSQLVECEASGCNTSNTSGLAGFLIALQVNPDLIRCVARDNTGSNTVGFFVSGATNDAHLTGCVAVGNGSHGFYTASTRRATFRHCDAYANGGDGLRIDRSANSINVYVESSNFVANGGYGVNGVGAGTKHGRIVKCGFGGGASANTSGATNGLSAVEVVGSVNYTTHPWTDPANDDFRITSTEAKGAGAGTFPAGVPLTVGAPDIGAAQSAGAGGAGFLIDGGLVL